MPSSPVRILAYVRVSSQEQGRSGTSLDGQREEIARFCAASGYPDPSFFVEVESAGAEKLARRAQLRALLDDARTGDLVVVAKQDRWSRDTLFYLQSTRDLVERGVRFFSIAERFDPQTPEGRFAATIMAAVAEQELERIRARTVGRRKELRDAGLYVEGLPPLGYRREARKLVVHEPDAAIVRGIFERALRGQSIGAIREHLVEEHPDRYAWAKKSIGRMLRSRVYLGEVRTTTRGWIASHEAIVDRETWERVQRGLVERRRGGRTPVEGSRTEGWLLRGLATCAECGARMGAAYGPRGREGREYYACARRTRGEPCSTPYLRVDLTDPIVAAMTLARIVELRELFRDAPSRASKPAVDVADKRGRITARRERLIDLAERGTITPDELRARLERLDAELGRVEVANAAAERAARLDTPERRREMLRELRTAEIAWAKATVATRRGILAELASAIVLEAGSPPRISWRDPADLLRAPDP